MEETVFYTHSVLNNIFFTVKRLKMIGNEQDINIAHVDEILIMRFACSVSSCSLVVLLQIFPSPISTQGYVHYMPIVK